MTTWIHIYLDEKITNFPSSTLNFSVDNSWPLIDTLTNSNSSPSNVKSEYVDNDVDTDDVAVTTVILGSRSKSNLISDIE